MTKLRSLHLYLGCAFAPLLIYFSLSGAWQVFRLQDVHPDQPSTTRSWLHEISKPHRNSTLPGREPKRASSKVFDFLALVMALGVVVSTFLGLILALQYKRKRFWVLTSLILGTALPIVVLVMTI